MKQKDYEITYTERDGIFYPDLALPEQSEVGFGKYGQMRLDFLRKHRKGTYTKICFDITAILQ